MALHRPDRLIHDLQHLVRRYQSFVDERLQQDRLQGQRRGGDTSGYIVHVSLLSVDRGF